MKPARQSWIMAGGLLSAAAASLCCLGPLVALALGLGSFAVAGWLEAWRPAFLTLTAILLFLAWIFALRARVLAFRAKRSEAAAGAAGSLARLPRWPLVLLGIGTLAVAAVALFPSAIEIGNNRRPSLPVASAGLPLLRVRIPSMDCAACAVGIERNLRAVSGVHTAAVRYATKEAAITYDPSVVSPRALIAAIDATGFKAEPVK